MPSVVEFIGAEVTQCIFLPITLVFFYDFGQKDLNPGLANGNNATA